MATQTLTLLTPCFCGGAAGKNGPAELRIPSIRGQLRYWLRVLAHDKDEPSAAPKREHQIFGGIQGRNLGFRHPIDHNATLESLASSVILRFTSGSNLKQDDHVLMCPHDAGKGSRHALTMDQSFDLGWTFSTTTTDEIRNHFLGAFKAWVLLGSLGARANRGAGSIWRANWNPTEKEYLAMVANLPWHKKMQDILTIKVLRHLTSNEINAWSHNSHSRDGDDSPKDDRNLLRAIATDTLALGNNCGGALGFGGNEGRKASPLKLKIGRFDTGFRLIAVIDKRNNRNGDIDCAVKRLKDARKPIGILLSDAGIDRKSST